MLRWLHKLAPLRSRSGADDDGGPHVISGSIRTESDRRHGGGKEEWERLEDAEGRAHRRTENGKMDEEATKCPTLPKKKSNLTHFLGGGGMGIIIGYCDIF